MRVRSSLQLLQPIVGCVFCFTLTLCHGARKDNDFHALMDHADEKLAELLTRQTTSFADTVAAYRQRRHRAPPHGFEDWYKLAQRYNATLIEDFFDPIYEDLSQYAHLDPAYLRIYADQVAKSSPGLVNGVFIERGQTSSNCILGQYPCFEFEQMLATISTWLPDMSIPKNSNSSPRIWIPHGDPNETYLISGPTAPFGKIFSRRDKPRITASDACPPTSPLRRALSRKDSEQSYASTLDTSSRYDDICAQPSLLEKHGALVAPLRRSITRNLVPLFAPARLSIETAIRYPDTIYWVQDPDYHLGSTSTGQTPWTQKANKIFWRGTNTGGAHGPKTWQHFHRHRFVALTNVTYIRAVQASLESNWAGLDLSQVSIAERLAEQYADIGFSGIMCRDDRFQWLNRPCSYLDAHFSPVPWVPLRQVLSKYRYLVDVDGHSFSGRFHAMLLSNSVVFKATLYREWHDARLIPWLHFVPISQDFGLDMWKALDFFLNNEDRAIHIANTSRTWALRVLRREDMELYLLRLLLEWARMIKAR